MSSRRYLAIVGLIWCSWLAAAGYRAISEFFCWRPEVIGPEIPYLLTVHGTRTDVVSSVSYFVSMLLLGGVCCMPIEAAKLRALSLRLPTLLYILLVALQLVLLGDVLRTYAYDWWRYLLSLAHIRMIDSSAWMRTSVARVPWVSGLATLCITLFLCYL